ncbi:MAG: MauE/DoxX family redox-associated membrane protein [Shimia sp.]
MTAQTATLYRMVMDKHLCPHGLKTKDMLRRAGYAVEDHPLRTRAEVDAFKAEHGVKTTPQVFIGGTRVGGYEDTRAHLGKMPKADVTYTPVIALFSVAALLAIAVTWLSAGVLLAPQTIGSFIAIAMVLLGLQKLQDLQKFSTMFLNYDLLARRWVPWGYVYPFIETGAGLLMLMGVLTWIAAPAALFAAGIGAVSVIKAVYIDKRELKCACMGDSRVPLGFVSLVENLMMVGMALWMVAML